MNKKGFSLVELMVVIAIMGLLSSIMIINLNQARSKSRDSKRLSDISNIQLALALYLNNNNSYPITSAGLAPLVTAGFLASVPTDPRPDATHTYGYTSDGTTYCLGATLENTSNTYINNGVTCNSGNAANNYKVTK